MRDRLIELILNSEILCDTCGESTNTYCAEALADHLLSNGIIVPPCELGDTVYIPVSNTILHTKVFAFGVDEDGNKVINPKEYPEGVFGVVGCEIGKNVFPTKEEAEQALKEREQDGC